VYIFDDTAGKAYWPDDFVELFCWARWRNDARLSDVLRARRSPMNGREHPRELDRVRRDLAAAFRLERDAVSEAAPECFHALLWTWKPGYARSNLRRPSLKLTLD
jgi:hypothetical protein